MSFSLLAITGSALLSVASPQKCDTAHHVGYIKPGAAITVSHDYDGQTAVGEFETVTANISHIYEDGLLSIELLTPPDLHVASSLPSHKTPLFSGSTLTVPIQFSGRTSGRFSISLQTVYESPDGYQSRRVVSIPVTIGLKTTTKTRPNELVTTKSDTTGLIGLPAIEVIE